MPGSPAKNTSRAPPASVASTVYSGEPSSMSAPDSSKLDVMTICAAEGAVAPRLRVGYRST